MCYMHLFLHFLWTVYIQKHYYYYYYYSNNRLNKEIWTCWCLCFLFLFSKQHLQIDRKTCGISYRKTNICILFMFFSMNYHKQWITMANSRVNHWNTTGLFSVTEYQLIRRRSREQSIMEHCWLYTSNLVYKTRGKSNRLSDDFLLELGFLRMCKSHTS